jgi:hypothetical protein
MLPAAQAQTTSDDPAQAAADTAHRRLLAQEQPSWVTPALGALAAVLALVAGVAVLVVRRASRGQRAGQTA